MRIIHVLFVIILWDLLLLLMRITYVSFVIISWDLLLPSNANIHDTCCVTEWPEFLEGLRFLTHREIFSKSY